MVNSNPVQQTVPTQVQRVGIIGGGQLAWMMAEAAQKLGIDLIVQTPHPTDPAVTIARESIFAPVADAEATAALAQRCDVITFENEFVDLPKLNRLAQEGVIFRPGLNCLTPLLDKYHQRCFLRHRDLPTPDFSLLPTSPYPLIPNRLPCVLKTRRLGYDGYGTFIVKTEDQFEELIYKIPVDALMLEEFVPFTRELAVMAARSLSGEVVVYPIVETQQENQVCRRVFVPTDLLPRVEQQVHAIAQTILESLQYVGILGIELFLTADDRVLVNEIAPRTHNSGHYTLDACEVSQFEQQLRAVCGLPLGSPALNCAGAVMVNLLGFESSSGDYAQQRQQLAAIPNAQVHWYGKTESRPGRKLGHVTVRLFQEENLAETSIALAQEIERIWYPDQAPA